MKRITNKNGIPIVTLHDIQLHINNLESQLTEHKEDNKLRIELNQKYEDEILTLGRQLTEKDREIAELKTAPYALDTIAKLEAQLAQAVEVIEDFRDHGTRHDLNPTGKFMSCGCFNSFSEDHWQGYIRSQDSYVREKAREFLAKVKGSKE